MEKKRDWKFIIGTCLLIAGLIFIAAMFWRTVSQQAALLEEEKRREEENAIEAIYIYKGDILKTGVFVNMETNDIFKASVPAQGIVNRAGKLIAGDVLEEGDKVRITGSFSFETGGEPSSLEETAPSEDIPRISGITKMERTGRATLEEADVYRKLVNPSEHEKS